MYENFYINSFEPKNFNGKYLLFVHGGPGNNSAVFEKYVKESDIYNTSSYGWIFYDQRGCGRSKDFELETLTHKNNVSDLSEIFKHLHLKKSLCIHAIVGHSYGARLVHDAFIDNNINSLPVLVGLANDFRVARIRSTIMDTLNLKLLQANDYEKIFKEIDKNKKEIWKNRDLLREVMNHEDKRNLFYWGNLEIMRFTQKIKDSLDIKETNSVTFKRVRKDLHSDKNNYSGPYPDKLYKKPLWINGLHDFLMGGEFMDMHQSHITTFFNSGHYPHIEEPKRFLDEISAFTSGQS